MYTLPGCTQLFHIVQKWQSVRSWERTVDMITAHPEGHHAVASCVLVQMVWRHGGCYWSRRELLLGHSLHQEASYGSWFPREECPRILGGLFVDNHGSCSSDAPHLIREDTYNLNNTFFVHFLLSPKLIWNFFHILSISILTYSSHDGLTTGTQWSTSRYIFKLQGCSIELIPLPANNSATCCPKAKRWLNNKRAFCLS